jgi:hypothetical protein
MCEPTTLALASFGLGAAQGISSYMGQQKRANQINSYYIQNAELAKRGAARNYQAAATELLSEREATAERNLETGIDALRARGTARAAAAGVSGLSVNAMLRDVYSQEGRSVASARRNLDFAEIGYGFRVRDIQDAAQSQINSAPRADKPSKFSAFLDIAGAGVDAMSQYKIMTRGRPDGP